jgi:hypothetical protein
MFDLWVENQITKECFRVTRDETKPIYYDEDGNVVNNFDLSDISKYRFYPCCPKEAPKNNNIIETGEQLNIFDFMKG